MTKEEILPFAEEVTRTNQRTIITYHNGTRLVGFFEGNPKSELRDKNQWNFIVFPVVDGILKTSTLNGEDFKSIEIIELK